MKHADEMKLFKKTILQKVAESVFGQTGRQLLVLKGKGLRC